MKVKQIDTTGNQVKEIQVSSALFDGKVNVDLVAQYMHIHRKHRALGTKKTKGRGEVRGGGRKPWRQKGTGRARHGSIRSPIWIGGGHTHTILPQLSERSRLPKNMRVAALSSVLTSQRGEDAILFLESFKLEKPKTQEVLNVLKSLGLEDKKVLFVTEEKDSILEKSGRSIASVTVREARVLSVFDLVSAERVVFIAGAAKTVADQYNK